MRTFDTGATRDSDSDKLDYEAFLSPLVLACYAEFMHRKRIQPDGNIRDGDNWQRGMPLDSFMKSGWRHFHDWWTMHRGNPGSEPLNDALCALMFNVMGYLHKVLTAQGKKANVES